MDQVADLVLPPYKPWDAMICISQAALDFTTRLHDEMKAWWSAQTGATRFNTPQLPVIALGVDCPAFTPKAELRQPARSALQLQANEVAFLFSGRLSFHAKANPAPMYQALEQAAQHASVVCIEAGVFPHEAIHAGFLAAQKTLAPSDGLICGGLGLAVGNIHATARSLIYFGGKRFFANEEPFGITSNAKTIRSSSDSNGIV